MRLVPAKWEGFQSKLLQPILKCSDEWLACFCAGVFLSSAGYFVLITSPDSELLQVLVSVTAVSMMTAVAYYVSWSKQQDRLARLGSQGSPSQQHIGRGVGSFLQRYSGRVLADCGSSGVAASHSRFIIASTLHGPGPAKTK